MHLLDGNVLVALAVVDHVHHERAEDWFGTGRPFATCPITQGTLLRYLIRSGARAPQALRQLDGFTARTEHEFWPDDVSYTEVRIDGVIGHRQVTDTYLAGLARRHGCRVATFDRGLATLHSDVASLLPSEASAMANETPDP